MPCACYAAENTTTKIYKEENSMKNFKKVLALVLAIATILSFATIASAATADFKDAKDVTHTEAVDVLSAIGVLNGYKDGDHPCRSCQDHRYV